MKVWVCYTERGYEGCSEPLAVFGSPRLAELYLRGYEASYSSGLKVKEMEVEE